MEGNQSRVMMSYKGIGQDFDIHLDEIKSLGPSSCVNVKLVDFWLAVVQKERPGFCLPEKIHIFDAEFYRRLTEEVTAPRDISVSENKARHNKVADWTKQVKLFGKDYLIVPISFWVEDEDDQMINKQWSVAVICYPDVRSRDTKDFRGKLRKPCILYFDPIGRGKSRAEDVYKNLTAYLTEEYKAKFGRLSMYRSRNLRRLYPKVLHQNREQESALLVLQYVESFFDNPITESQLSGDASIDAMYDFDLVGWFPREKVDQKRNEMFSFIKNFIFQHHAENAAYIPSIFKGENENVDTHDVSTMVLGTQDESQYSIKEETNTCEENNLSDSRSTTPEPQPQADLHSQLTPGLLKAITDSDILSQQFSQMQCDEVEVKTSTVIEPEKIEPMDISSASSLFGNLSPIGVPAVVDAEDMEIAGTSQASEAPTTTLAQDAPCPQEKTSRTHSTVFVDNSDSDDELLSKISSQVFTRSQGSNDIITITNSDAPQPSLTTPSSSNILMNISKKMVQSGFYSNRGLTKQSKSRKRKAPIKLVPQTTWVQVPTSSVTLRKIPSTTYAASKNKKEKLTPVFLYIDDCDSFLFTHTRQKILKCSGLSNVVLIHNFEDKRMTHFIINYHRVSGIIKSKKLFLALGNRVKIVSWGWLDYALQKNSLAPEENYNPSHLKITNWPYNYDGLTKNVLEGFNIILLSPFSISHYELSRDDLIEVIRNAKGVVIETQLEFAEDMFDKLPKISKLEMQKTFVVANNINFRQTECNDLFKKFMWITFHPDIILHSIWTGICCLTSDEVKQFMLTTHLLIEAKKLGAVTTD